MNQRSTVWNWAAAAVSFASGLYLVLNDSAAGWILILLGILYIGLASPGGQAFTSKNPRLVRLGLISVAILLLLVLVVGLAVFQLK